MGWPHLNQFHLQWPFSQCHILRYGRLGLAHVNLGEERPLSTYNIPLGAAYCVHSMRKKKSKDTEKWTSNYETPQVSSSKKEKAGYKHCSPRRKWRMFSWWWSKVRLGEITCILSSVKQIASPGWMHETSARGQCTGKTQRNGMGREVGGGFRMADSCQCMAKNTIIL